jgi:hypothetical protein
VAATAEMAEIGHFRIYQATAWPAFLFGLPPVRLV